MALLSSIPTVACPRLESQVVEKEQATTPQISPWLRESSPKSNCGLLAFQVAIYIYIYIYIYVSISISISISPLKEPFKGNL